MIINRSIILSLLLVILFITPVMGVSINYDYSTSNHATSGFTLNAGSYGRPLTGIVFKDIGKYGGLQAGVIGADVAAFGANPGWVTKSTDILYKIGDDIIGTGSFSVTNVRNSGETIVKTIGVFDTYTWDISGYSGTQQVIFDYDDEYFEGGYWGNGDSSFYWLPDGSSYYISPENIDESVHLTTAVNKELSDLYTVTVYNDIDFSANSIYTINDEGILSVYLNRSGYPIRADIYDNSGLHIYGETSTNNVEITSRNLPLNLSVKNPFINEYWNNTIPEASNQPLQDPAEFTSYIFDAQSGQLISGASVNKYYSDDSYTSTAGASGVVHDVVYWDDTDWAYFNVTASGYSYNSPGYNWTADSAPPGFHQQMIFQMLPDSAPSNSTYVLAFSIRQEISPGADVYSRSVDATVICDDVQHLSGPSGTTWFNVSAGSHAYTVSKNGFETVQGTVTVSDLNTLETVYLPLSLVEPTLSGNETSDEVGDEDMHEAIAEAYAEFGAFIPEAVMIGCVLFLLSMFKKF